MLKTGNTYKWITNKNPIFWIDEKGTLINSNINQNDVFMLLDYKYENTTLPGGLVLKECQFNILFDNKKWFMYCVFVSGSETIEKFVELLC